MARWFGEEHLSFNKKFKGIQKTKPLIWGYDNRIILMLEVGYDEETCITTRNVIFWLNPQAPQTLISPTVKELIMIDCRLYAIMTPIPEPIPININGRKVKANINRGRYQNSNILGMDFITANCVEFKMKINKYNWFKNRLSFKFDTCASK